MSNLVKRIISAAIIAPIAGGALYLGGYYFLGLILVITILSSLELDNMRKDGFKLLYLTLLPLVIGYLNTQLGIQIFVISMLMLFLLIKYIDLKIECLSFGAIYIFLPMLSAIYLREQPQGLQILVFIAACVVANDIFAYFIGKVIGKTKLSKISPNKTWEGLIGGVIASAITGYLLTGQGVYILYASAIAILALAGDLLESAIKRHFNVKDSGNIIPGHGGVLDRIDGFMIVLPAVAVLYFLSS